MHLYLKLIKFNPNNIRRNTKIHFYPYTKLIKYKHPIIPLIKILLI